MKRNKSTKSEAGESTGAPTESRLVLKRRPVASLSEKQLSDVAGGHPHTCEPTCPHTCCGDTCDRTCGDTCEGYTCEDTWGLPTCVDTCPVDECTVP